MDSFIGEIKLLAFTYAPAGWGHCNGQLLPVPQNQALYVLLENRYGGDRNRTFALPDLRSRAPIHRGRQPALAPQDVANPAALRSADPSDDATGRAGSLALNFCIALEGIFPSRNW